MNISQTQIEHSVKSSIGRLSEKWRLPQKRRIHFQKHVTGHGKSHVGRNFNILRDKHPVQFKIIDTAASRINAHMNEFGLQFVIEDLKFTNEYRGNRLAHECAQIFYTLQVGYQFSLHNLIVKIPIGVSKDELKRIGAQVSKGYCLNRSGNLHSIECDQEKIIFYFLELLDMIVLNITGHSKAEPIARREIFPYIVTAPFVHENEAGLLRKLENHAMGLFEEARRLSDQVLAKLETKDLYLGLEFHTFKPEDILQDETFRQLQAIPRKLRDYAEEKLKNNPTNNEYVAKYETFVNDLKENYAFFLKRLQTEIVSRRPTTAEILSKFLVLLLKKLFESFGGMNTLFDSITSLFDPG